MHFCKICDNMYYIRIHKDDANSLVYYCRKCGDEEDISNTENVCVSKTQIKKGEQKFNHMINEYTKYDPTLPRLTNLACPNVECESNHPETWKSTHHPEIIYIRYDNDNLKMVYLCTVCDHIWKTSE